MTPEMIDEIEAGLVERTGGWCFRIEQAADELDPDAPAGQAFGVTIVDTRGNAVTVECALVEDGSAQVVVRQYGREGDEVDPIVFTMPGSVMVTT